MSNLEKSVAINLENTAHYENISNLDITFRTGESDSSVLLLISLKIINRYYWVKKISKHE